MEGNRSLYLLPLILCDGYDIRQNPSADSTADYLSVTDAFVAEMKVYSDMVLQAWPISLQLTPQPVYKPTNQNASPRTTHMGSNDVYKMAMHTGLRGYQADRLPWKYPLMRL